MPSPDLGERLATYRLFGTTVSSDFPLTSSLVPSRADTELTLLSADPSWDSSGLELLYRSDRSAGDGKPGATLLQRDGLHVLTFTDEATFLIRPKEIGLDIAERGSDRFAELAFLGPVMALWLELAGVITLHASAVAVPGGAIAFVGGQGSRKTSCAAAMLRHSHPLLADDLVAIEQTVKGFVCRPGYPEMRMWPREVDFFVSPPQPLAPVQPGSTKCRVRVGESRYAAFSAANTELLALYVLNPETADDVTVRRLQAGEAVMRLVGGSSVPALTAALDLEGRRLRILADLVSSVPVAEVTFPAGPDGAVALAEAILADIG